MNIQLTCGLALLLSAINSELSTAMAQGALTPPGVPAPTMKSLDQVEARTPITNTASLVTISQPGSYYLTGNLTVSTGNGININTNGVTLDLNGFTIRSTAASATGNGISLNGTLSDFTICNGHIRGGVTNSAGIYGGGGFSGGIVVSGGQPVNGLASRISVSGCLVYGIFLGNGDSTMAEACTAHMVGGIGISASTVKTCAATDCGSTAILGDQVSDCRGESFSGEGIYAAIAQNCYGFSSSGTGLHASQTASGCYGYSSSGTGLSAFIANVCRGQTSVGTALSVTHNVNSF